MSDIRQYMKNRIQVLENTDEEIEEYENQLREHKKSKIKKGIFMLIIIALLVGAYMVYQNYKSFDGHEVVSTYDIAEVYNSQFIEYNEGFVKYNADGIEYIVDGKVVWKKGFEMKNPIIDVCNEYVAIAEQKSNKVYIFNTDGPQGEVETSYPIVTLEVAGQGVIAMVTAEEKLNHIEIMDKSGKQIAMGQTALSGDGAPVDLSISEDGTKLVVSYLYVSEGIMQSRVAFYNYSDVGKNEVDRLVGGFNHYESTIVAKVEFVNNDTAVAFGDDMITIYSMKQKPELITDIKIDKEIKSIAYSDEYISYIVETGEAKDQYEMNVYDLDGKNTACEKMSFEYKDMKMNGEVITLYNNSEINIYNASGTEKYKGVIEEGVSTVLTTTDSYKYMIMSGEKMYSIRLK